MMAVAMMVVMSVRVFVVVLMRVPVVMSVVMMMVIVVIVVLAHASVPVDGSAICSSISLRTPLIWASATV